MKKMIIEELFPLIGRETDFGFLTSKKPELEDMLSKWHISKKVFLKTCIGLHMMYNRDFQNPLKDGIFLCNDECCGEIIKKGCSIFHRTLDEESCEYNTRQIFSGKSHLEAHIVFLEIDKDSGCIPDNIEELIKENTLIFS